MTEPYRRNTTTGYISRVSMHSGPNRWIDATSHDWKEDTERDDGGFFLTSEESLRHQAAAKAARRRR